MIHIVTILKIRCLWLINRIKNVKSDDLYQVNLYMRGQKMELLWKKIQRLSTVTHAGPGLLIKFHVFNSCRFTIQLSLNNLWPIENLIHNSKKIFGNTRLFQNSHSFSTSKTPPWFPLIFLLGSPFYHQPNGFSCSFFLYIGFFFCSFTLTLKIFIRVSFIWTLFYCDGFSRIFTIYVGNNCWHFGSGWY